MSKESGIDNAGGPERIPQADVVPLDTARSRLATVWLCGAGLVLLVVVFQSLLGRYGDKTPEALGWLLSAIMPTLLLIITVLGYTALVPEFQRSVVRRDFFRVARYLSTAYLALVALTVLIGPFAAADGAGMIKLMHMSDLWLGPIQGLVASALGVLFVTKRSSEVSPGEVPHPHTPQLAAAAMPGPRPARGTPVSFSGDATVGVLQVQLGGSPLPPPDLVKSTATTPTYPLDHSDLDG